MHELPEDQQPQSRRWRNLFAYIDRAASFALPGQENCLNSGQQDAWTQHYYVYALPHVDNPELLLSFARRDDPNDLLDLAWYRRNTTAHAYQVEGTDQVVLVGLINTTILFPGPSEASILYQIVRRQQPYTEHGVVHGESRVGVLARMVTLLCTYDNDQRRATTVELVNQNPEDHPSEDDLPFHDNQVEDVGRAILRALARLRITGINLLAVCTDPADARKQFMKSLVRNLDDEVPALLANFSRLTGIQSFHSFLGERDGE